MGEWPRISKDGSGNTAWIELSALPEEKIDWKKAKESAKNALAEGRKIFWEFHLGLSEPFFPIDDEMRFQELSIALKHFSETLYPNFEAATLGAALYRGPLDLSGRFLWSSRQEENFACWKLETAQETPAPFYLDTYAAYFQLLAHKLPDTLPIYVLFDAAGLKRADALLLLTKERFQHFELAAKGVGASSWCIGWEEANSAFGWIGEEKAPDLPYEPRVGLMMPLNCEAAEFEKELQAMDAAGIPYRVVTEAFLTEEWDGLEAVVAGWVSPRGKRMLRGFLASGGIAVFSGERLGLPDEISLEEFRGRGIRTPDLLVPNQPR